MLSQVFVPHLHSRTSRSGMITLAHLTDLNITLPDALDGLAWRQIGRTLGTILLHQMPGTCVVKATEWQLFRDLLRCARSSEFVSRDADDIKCRLIPSGNKHCQKTWDVHPSKFETTSCCKNEKMFWRKCDTKNLQWDSTQNIPKSRPLSGILLAEKQRSYCACPVWPRKRGIRQFRWSRKLLFPIYRSTNGSSKPVLVLESVSEQVSLKQVNVPIQYSKPARFENFLSWKVRQASTGVNSVWTWLFFVKQGSYSETRWTSHRCQRHAPARKKWIRSRLSRLFSAEEKFSCCRSRILVRWPSGVWTLGGPWAQNVLKIGGLPLKLPENCMILKKSWGQGGLDPLVSWIGGTPHQIHARSERIPQLYLRLSRELSSVCSFLASQNVFFAFATRHCFVQIWECSCGCVRVVEFFSVIIWCSLYIYKWCEKSYLELGEEKKHILIPEAFAEIKRDTNDEWWNESSKCNGKRMFTLVLWRSQKQCHGWTIRPRRISMRFLAKTEEFDLFYCISTPAERSWRFKGISKISCLEPQNLFSRIAGLYISQDSKTLNQQQTSNKEICIDLKMSQNNFCSGIIFVCRPQKVQPFLLVPLKTNTNKLLLRCLWKIQAPEKQLESLKFIPMILKWDRGVGSKGVSEHSLACAKKQRKSSIRKSCRRVTKRRAF